jgi:hypothetical protein
MSPVKATTLEERRRLEKRRKARREIEIAKAVRISEEEEVATYLGFCPLFAAGLLELNEPNFVSLMLRTRQFMLNRALNQQRGETVIETHRKWKS